MKRKLVSFEAKISPWVKRKELELTGRVKCWFVLGLCCLVCGCGVELTAAYSQLLNCILALSFKESSGGTDCSYYSELYWCVCDLYRKQVRHCCDGDWVMFVLKS